MCGDENAGLTGIETLSVIATLVVIGDTTTWLLVPLLNFRRIFLLYLSIL